MIDLLKDITLLDKKTTEEAVKNIDKLAVLKPCEQLEVIISELINKNELGEKNFSWLNEQLIQNENYYKINEYFKIIQILRVLDSDISDKGIETLINTKIVEICVPKLFTNINKNITTNLALYSKNYTKIKGDGLDKLTLLLAIFPRKAAIDTIETLDMGEQGVKYLMAIDLLEDFTIINDKDELKRFIYKYGRDVNEYLFKLTANYIKVYEFPEYRYLSKKYLLEELIKQKEPIFPEDLVIDENDLMESGITDRDGAKELLIMLTEHVHNKPYKNNREDLLEEAEKFSRSKLKRIFRKVKWIK